MRKHVKPIISLFQKNHYNKYIFDDLAVDLDVQLSNKILFTICFWKVVSDKIRESYEQ